jgi:hypothetical protein
MRPYTSGSNRPSFLSYRRDDKGIQACRAPQFPQKSLLLPVDFAAVHARHHHIRDQMLSYSSTRRSASSPRAASSTTKPAQHRDDIGADVAIVARQHRGNASTRRQSYAPTAKPRCADINHNHARASRGDGRMLNERLTCLHNRQTISANIMTQQEMRAEPSL